MGNESLVMESHRPMAHPAISLPKEIKTAFLGVLRQGKHADKIAGFAAERQFRMRRLISAKDRNSDKNGSQASSVPSVPFVS